MRQYDKGWKLARILLGFTLAWNVIEFFVAIFAGDAANSTALIGFGLDSAIESFAALFALWTFRDLKIDPEKQEEKERKVHFVVGLSFILLSTYIVFEAIDKFIGREPATESLIGIILAAVSLVVMPILGTLKLRNAARIKSRALAAEAKETIACAGLSAALLIGLAANALWGWYWLDSATALALVPWLLKEGLEGLFGDDDDDDDGDED